MTNWWLAMLITYLDLMHAADAPLWLRHSPAALGEIKVHWSFSVFFFFFFGLVGGGGVVTTFTSNAVVFQQEEAADLTRRSGNDAIMEMNASKVSNWFPLRRRLFGPSAEEGVRVRHVKMTRRETSSVGGGEGGGHQPPFLPVFTKSGHITEPEKHTLDFLSRQEKGQSSNGGVKMSLSIQANLAADGGWARPGEGKPNGCGLRAAAVASVQRTGKSEEQTHEEHSPS